ncbi:hypothetical protein [Vibrio vulnificus]|uniref:hypothetical protein n=1 Tax=Vibrio vulnificus TaxID=672 RepID=UPI003241D4B9
MTSNPHDNVDPIDELFKKYKTKKGAEKNSSPDSDKSDYEQQLLAALKDKSEINTRSNLTTYFLVGLFSLLILAGIFVLWYNHLSVQWMLTLKYSGIDDAAERFKPLELESVLSLIINSFGTSLGFIIGYYFKDKISK